MKVEGAVKMGNELTNVWSVGHSGSGVQSLSSYSKV
jgi:hypothetical protein